MSIIEQDQQWPFIIDDNLKRNEKLFELVTDTPPFGLFVTNSDQVYAIGSDKIDDFGLGPVTSNIKMTRIDGLCAKKIKKFDWGENHILALSESGVVYAWGSNKYGQVGHNSTDPNTDPTAVTGVLTDKVVVDISCGAYHCVALTDKGDVVTWGSNTYGCTGHGFSDSHTWKPKMVDLDQQPIKAISTNQYASFFLNKHGEVWCCGDNRNGGLGLGDTVNRNIPTCLHNSDKMLYNHIEQISSGLEHTLALTSTGYLFTWGSNSHGQLGAGKQGNSSSPFRILDFDSPVMSMEAKRYTSTAKDESGTVFAWGLIRGTDVNTPTEISVEYPTELDNDIHEVIADNTKIVDDMSKAFDDQETSDFVITVENKKIHVHKLILQIGSEYFRTMFKGNWKEAEAKEIVDEHRTFEVYYAFLKFIYTGTLDDVGGKTALSLLEMANYTLDKRLTDVCVKYLEKNMNDDLVAKVFQVAETLKMDKLSNFCVKYTMKNFEEVMKSKAFADLSQEQIQIFMKEGAALGLGMCKIMG